MRNQNSNDKYAIMSVWFPFVNLLFTLAMVFLATIFLAMSDTNIEEVYLGIVFAMSLWGLGVNIKYAVSFGLKAGNKKWLAVLGIAISVFMALFALLSVMMYFIDVKTGSTTKIGVFPIIYMALIAWANKAFVGRMFKGKKPELPPAPLVMDKSDAAIASGGRLKGYMSWAIIIVAVVAIGWFVQGCYFNFVVSPQKQLEHYLASKYKGVEFEYVQNFEKVELGSKHDLVDNFTRNMRWSFSVYPKDNKNLKFGVHSFNDIENTSYSTGSGRRFLWVLNTDDFDDVLLGEIAEMLPPLDIYNPDSDEVNAKRIYEAIKHVESLNEKYGVKYKYRHYLDVQVFIGNSGDKIYDTEIGGIHTLESIAYSIERARDDILRFIHE
ncbi:MAG: hypothetical protein LBL34_00055 [Clostridiales bacterium]|jgi:hypothetical protein|nr:hypothetical protein [Clostridiales bacterium]